MQQSPTLSWLIIFVTLSFSAKAQKKWDKVYADTNSFFIHTATVAGRKYISFINDQTYCLLNARGDTLLKRTDYYNSTGFKDFNKDGYLDIFLDNATNAVLVSDLFLYVPVTGEFKEVKHFRDFPAPEPIKGTRYYYSYHKSGCADMNWDSDLFYIENYKAIRIGNISGRQCGDEDLKDAVYIHKIHSGRKKLFRTLPIDTIWKYKDLKWGFIKAYWAKNYKLFL